MQLDLPFLSTPDPPILEFVRVPRARRYVIRVRPDGRVRVTVPRGGSRAEALRFVESHRAWIAKEQLRVASTHAPRGWTTGTPILLAGRLETIVVTPAGAGTTVTYGPRTISIPAGVVDVRPYVERDLRTLAQQELAPRLAELAAVHQLAVSRTTVRNQRSRWGSCSRTGAIALNFRLVQMPPEVRDYVLIHELMHLRQQNHSRRFWRLVEAAFPAFREAERWLRVEGRALF